jgi:hypothetical protein
VRELGRRPGHWHRRNLRRRPLERRRRGRRPGEGATGTHYIDYLLVDSGLPKDPNAGGDSSYEGSYPDVETTQVAMTDQSQRYDLTHEFNHVLENSYGTVPGQKVSWIQESYNDYLILLTAENANGAAPGQSAQFTLPSNVGYLDALVLASGSTAITLTRPPRNDVVVVVITNVTMGGYKSALSYGWDPNETFGYSIQVTGGTAAPTNRTYF